MKKLLRNLSMLTLMIIGGAQMAWAATEEYDFATFVAGGAPTTLDLSTTAVEQDGTNAKTVYVVKNPTNTTAGVTLDLKGRIALDSHNKTGNQMRWMWRSNSAKAYQNGLAGNWNGGGTVVTSFNISILNLYAGDKVTITYAIGNAAAKPHACSAGIISPDGTAGNALAAEAIVESNKTYTVLKDGNLDMYVTNNNMAIQKIEIKSDHIAESIDAPVISVVGANLGDRIVSIESNKTNTDAATVTYYTLDGTDPTTASTKYVGNITVTDANVVEGKVTIKAITYKDGDTNIASDIRTLILTDVGTTLTLNAPVINMNFVKNGSYYSPVYSFVSDQNSVVGKPKATISYSINRGSSFNGNSYTASTKGELTVTVSAAGYTSASASTTIDNFIFDRTFYYDFTSFTEHSDVTVGNSTLVNGEGCQAYSLSSDAVEGITITDMQLLWAIRKDLARGLFARNGTGGSIEYNGSFPTGSYAVFSNNGTAVVSKTAKTEFAQYGLAKDMAVYVPATGVTISLPADYIYSTFSSELDLDFTDNANVEAYTAKADGTTVTLTKVGKVAANTGLLLKKLGNATTATVPLAEDAAMANDNDLVAVKTPISAGSLIAAGNAYVLTSDTQFSKVVSGATGEIPAGKAYLAYNNDKQAAPVMHLSFGEATAVNGIEVKPTHTNNVIYNLQGVRVNKPTANGLYIINGKKYLHK